MALARRLILDSGAVIGLARNDMRARAHLAAAHERGVQVSIPSVVLAETVRGRNDDAPVHRVINAVGEVSDSVEEDGRLAGRLLGDTGLASTIDALIVASVDRAGGGVVLTSDPSDLTALAAELDTVHIQAL